LVESKFVICQIIGENHFVKEGVRLFAIVTVSSSVMSVLIAAAVVIAGIPRVGPTAAMTPMIF
jgi:hypothetical protein